MENENKENKSRKTIFQITCAILIGILIVGIVVQICVIVNLKNKKEKRKHENEEIPQITEEKMVEKWQEIYLNSIKNF